MLCATNKAIGSVARFMDLSTNCGFLEQPIFYGWIKAEATGSVDFYWCYLITPLLCSH